MKNTYNTGLGTHFVYDDESKLLTLTSLAGMACGHNGLEDDFSCSGLAIVCIDNMRFEGAKLEYTVNESANNTFSFSAADKNKTFRLNAVWQFEKDYKLISCKYTLSNTSGRKFILRRALPRFVFAPGEYELMWQMCRWNNENQMQSAKLRGEDIFLHARPARSTVGSAPFCILKDTENMTATAFHVMPRGNWTIQAHSDILSNEAPTPVIEAGLADTDLFMEVEANAEIELPEIIIQAVPNADILISGAALHRYIIEKRLPEDIHRTPVIYNTWLYRFTNFNIEQLRKQLQAAAKIGCEIFIIDAGWFGADKSWGQVGDWREKENEPFFGNMSAFADEVRAAGLQFGFWIEPERWAKNIPIRTEHPEWFPENTTRIDLTQPAAADHFYHIVVDNVKKFGAKYIKVDFNASVGFDDSGSELLNYCTILEQQFKRIRKACPDLIIENCGSGALRNDLASQMFFDHNFVSDNANPCETLAVRQGAFMRTLPGRVLNWATMRPAPERRTPVSKCTQVMACAAATWDEAGLFDVDYVMTSALLGIPGFSGELAELPQEVQSRLAEYVAFYKENRDFISNAHCYLLTPPADKVTDYEKYYAFQMQKHDASDSLVYVFTNPSSRRALRSFRLHNLKSDKMYRINCPFAAENETIEISGRELMEYGLTAFIPENQHSHHAAALYSVKEI